MRIKSAGWRVVCLGMCGLVLSGAVPFDPTGDWKGVADDNGTAIRFTLTIEGSKEALRGMIDVVDLGTKTALEDLAFDGRTLSFRFALDGNNIDCEADLQDDETFSGSFQSANGGAGAFTLKRNQ